MMAQPTEPRIVDAVLRGDRAALGQLLSTYQHTIYNVCLRMVTNRDDAAEAAQETMLKVIEHVGEFHGNSDIATWMVRIAMNVSISRLRKRKVRQAMSLDGDPRSANGNSWDPADNQATPLSREIADHREPAPDAGVQQKETFAQLHAALGRLEEDFRAVLVLRDIQEMDYQQIAGVLAVPVGTVKSRLFRARLALRHEMLKIPAPKAAVQREDGHG
jgi:RNA polymerase sigma-70 factor, ECF subfamily